MINATAARTLCSSAEYELLRLSTPKQVAFLSIPQLSAARARARKLRNKYRDLASRQRRESRGKSAPKGKRPSLSNDNTLRKVEFFETALARFEEAIARATEARSKPATKPAKKTAKPAAKPAAKKSKPKAAAIAKPAKASTADARRVVTLAGAVTATPQPVVDTLGAASARDFSLRARSKKSAIGRLRNILAGSPSKRLQGHASASTRKAQGRRDAQQRGEKRPSTR